ncbi:MAG: tRNA (adenosine(37)-N6)-threonylcarbamoyltransferase complex transferase subunit TsaD [Planctomycetes bacterium]|nr:tRNA (adenosine(37)-N6)-threonylcarbamoyltransferase complex transferase subunit TsaD [Planctomycetota bacterium]
MSSRGRHVRPLCSGEGHGPGIRDVLILGIESSCDETSVALVEDGRRVRASVVASQIDLHARYGGVVPELAARAHIECLVPVMNEALQAADVAVADVDAIAVVNMPGLIGSLLIGVTAAKTLAWIHDKPLVAVNHIQAHPYAVCLDNDIEPWPCVSLVVSGGHTTLYHSTGPLEIQRIGRTVDDAAGEAFDKVAAILELPYPGGPSIDRLSKQGNPKALAFKRSAVGPEQLDFSFSGIKTAVLYEVCGHDLSRTAASMSDDRKADIAASFQEAVVDMLVANTMRAAELRAAETVVLGGGVAANGRLRTKMAEAACRRGLVCHVPPLKYCTDNAAMVAGLAHHMILDGRTADLAFEAKA